jgi:SAM-dependent methyltransferase
MTDQQIRFDDGVAYERFMGKWSQSAGEVFLPWLAPDADLRWLDVGCGNGAFTEMLVQQCSPLEVQGVDPSEAQLAFASTRLAPELARFELGDAMELPYADGAFDAAVMALVIFFVPDPARGVAEMARVVCPGGLVTAYGWDLTGGGFPYETLQAEMRSMDVAVPMPPSPDASRSDSLRALWTGAGLVDVETHEITVQRTYANFDDYWTTILGGPSVRKAMSTMIPVQRAQLEARTRARLVADTAGRITLEARANAVKGRVPRP